MAGNTNVREEKKERMPSRVRLDRKKKREKENTIKKKVILKVKIEKHQGWSG